MPLGLFVSSHNSKEILHVHPFFLALYIHQEWTKDYVDSELQSYINHSSISSYCCENSALLQTVFIESLFCVSIPWKSPGVQQSRSDSLLLWLLSFCGWCAQRGLAAEIPRSVPWADPKPITELPVPPWGFGRSSCNGKQVALTSRASRNADQHF